MKKLLPIIFLTSLATAFILLFATDNQWRQPSKVWLQQKKEAAVEWVQDKKRVARDWWIKKRDNLQRFNENQ